MILSKTCNYAVRALLYVAAQNHTNYVPVREISRKLDISFHFLSKIHLILIQNGLTTSSRGAHGGVSLARPAASISIYDIVEAVDGSQMFTECVLGLEFCSDEHPCPMHDQWSSYRVTLKNLFKEVSLADLAEKISNKEARLTNMEDFIKPKTDS